MKSGIMLQVTKGYISKVELIDIEMECGSSDTAPERKNPDVRCSILR